MDFMDIPQTYCCECNSEECNASYEASIFEYSALAKHGVFILAPNCTADASCMNYELGWSYFQLLPKISI